MHFKINLTLVAVLTVVLYFNIPFYKNWFNTNLNGPAFNIINLSKQMSIEQRKINRYGYSYAIYREMAGIFKSAKIADPVVLLPPDAYMKEHGVKDFAIVEPAIFYYFTANKGVWYNSPGVEKANCMIVPDGHGKVMMRKIPGPEEVNKIVGELKKYKIE